MAGIGFEINRLARRDDIMGIMGAYLHSALAICGPWLVTVLALAIITYMYGGEADNLQLLTFRGIIVYNFSISLVLAAPVFMVITRHLADQIHVKNVTATPTVVMESMILVYLMQLPIALWLYGVYFELPMELRLIGFANMFLIAAVWLLGVYLTALKDFMGVTRSFTIGMIVAIVGAKMMHGYNAAGMLVGFSAGLALILFGMAARILSEYPYRLTIKFALKPYFKKYWELFFAGFFYNAAIWVDKWIMWFAPEATLLPSINDASVSSNIRFYPDYDSAMFLAFLTIVPSMALFVFSVETTFFHHYRRFYTNILEHAPLKRLRHFHKLILESLYEGARNLTFLQGAVAIFAIVMAPFIFLKLNIDFMQLSMFRLGVLGAFFQVLFLFVTIIQSYFDCRRSIMYLYGWFFFTNAVMTYICLQYGFEYYGFGFFLSAASSFALAAVVLFQHVRKLPYHAFITNNNSVRNKTLTMATHPIE